METLTHTMGGLEWTTRVPENDADLREFKEWVEEQEQRSVTVGVDSEGTGLGIFGADFRLRLVQFGTPNEAWLIPVEAGGSARYAATWALGTLSRMVAHNASFDGLVFDRHLGVSLREFMGRTLDTRIYAHLLDSRRDYEGGTGHSLKNLAVHYVDPGADDGQRELQAEFRKVGATKDTGWAKIPLGNAVYRLYSAADVVLVTRLLSALEQRCEAENVPAPLIDYEHRVSYIGASVQRAGMRLDVDYTRRLIRELKAEEEHYAAVAAGYGVTSVNAPKQVGEALIAMGESLTERTTTGNLAVGKEVLLPLADLDNRWERIGAREPNPLADAVLRAKRAGKWRSSYADAMLEGRDADNRVHPSINTMGARTARWSVSGPPLQQLPSSSKRIRRCIVAAPGHVLLAADFKQVELRVLAALAGAEDLIERINNGEDLHTVTTRLVHGIGPEMTDEEIGKDPRRKQTKSISLGKAYAGGANTLAKQTGLPLGQVKQALAKYDRALPEIGAFARYLTRKAQEEGMQLRTPSGRTLKLDRDKSYTAIAFMCQSTARDVLGQALLNLDNVGLLPRIVGVVHDEVLFEVPEEEAAATVERIQSQMEMPFYGIKIESDPDILGPSWAGDV